MEKKKFPPSNEKPDEWTELAMNILDGLNFNYQNYNQERNSIIVSRKTYDKMKKLSDEFRANNIV
jgi:hypothetical protein